MNATTHFVSLLLCILKDYEDHTLPKHVFEETLSSINPNIEYFCHPDYVVAVRPDGTRIDMFDVYSDDEEDEWKPTEQFIAELSSPTTVFCFSSDEWYISFRIVDGVIQFCQTTLYGEDDINYIGDGSYAGLMFHTDGWFNLVDTNK